MTQILVFGDSISYGAWDKEGGWVSRLRKFLDEKNLSNPDSRCLIYNLGVSGNNSEDSLREVGKMKAFIIHGAYGDPEENWFPWLKEKLDLIITYSLPPYLENFHYCYNHYSISD